MNYHYITGTSQGIGKAIAEALLEDERNIVYGAARNKTIQHANYHHLYIDLTDISKVSEIEFAPHEDADRLVLINNAGMLGDIKHFGDLEAQDIANSYNLNVVAPAILINQFIQQYKDRNCEKLVINITSGAAQSPYDGWGVYCSSKASVDMMSRVAALEQDMDDVQYPTKVLAVAPGVVETNMQESIRNSDVEGFSRKQKFIELKEKEQLYEAAAVGRKYAEIISNPKLVEEVISRISL